MSCFHRMIAYLVPLPGGRRKLYFRPPPDLLHPDDFCITLPCGQCIGCRLDKSREWAIRCVHEASLYDENYFITLTYAPEHLQSASLQVRDLQLFFKRLRKSLGAFRYYACGEYGAQRMRPHFHALCFGLHIPDLTLFSVRRGYRFFRSQSVERVWPYGFVTIGYVSFESAAYVARYVHKKLVGRRASEYGDLHPEFAVMSRKPGIAHDWIARYHGDVYKDDGSSYVPFRGSTRIRVPRFYDHVFESIDPDTMINCRDHRAMFGRVRDIDDLLDRPSDRQREIVCRSRVDRLCRIIEDFDDPAF